MGEGVRKEDEDVEEGAQGTVEIARPTPSSPSYGPSPPTHTHTCSRLHWAGCRRRGSLPAWAGPAAAAGRPERGPGEGGEGGRV